MSIHTIPLLSSSGTHTTRVRWWPRRRHQELEFGMDVTLLMWMCDVWMCKAHMPTWCKVQ